MYRRSLSDNQPPNKRLRPEPVLPEDFFDSTDIQADDPPDEPSPPLSPSYWARERLFDETFEQTIYDQRAANLIKRREHLKSQSESQNWLTRDTNSPEKEGLSPPKPPNDPSETSLSDSDGSSDGSRDWRARGGCPRDTSRGGTHKKGTHRGRACP